MRSARCKEIVNPKTGRRRNVYYGGFRYRGKQYWVSGQYDSARAWEREADLIKAKVEQESQAIATAQARSANPTLAQFAGAIIDEKTGRITTAWPRSHPKRRRRKQTSVRRAEEAIRPLIRRFGECCAHDISPAEAYDFLLDAGTNTRQCSAQLFDDLLRLHPVPGQRNPFRGHDLPPRRRRKADPEFRVLTDEQFERLIRVAGEVRKDDYGLNQQALVIAMGTSCARPSECFAFRFERQPRLATGVQPSWIDFEADEIHISSQFDDKGVEVLPKDNEERIVALPPPMKAAILAAPRISEFVFPAVRGGRLTIGLWDGHYWPAIRGAFGDTTLEFYDLKHRAITWCCTPIASGGLGLDPVTAAHQAGHNDGGLTIVKYYLKLNEQLARQRIKDAMAAHAALSTANNGQPDLRVVGG